MYPTVLSGLHPQGEVIKTEIFGPVLGMVHLNQSRKPSIWSTVGSMATWHVCSRAGIRCSQVPHDADAGNIGINIGVAAPMAYFPFSGWKDSFFGTLHGQGKHAVEFFTQTKVVVERWPKDWNRQF